jgi:hypothetical protein
MLWSQKKTPKSLSYYYMNSNYVPDISNCKVRYCALRSLEQENSVKTLKMRNLISARLVNLLSISGIL